MSIDASVLVVDDDDVFRRVLGGELERLGLRVMPAESGTAALRRLADAEPDVVLLDLRLPDMSGLDVLRTIRDAHPSTDVIMLTGHGSIDVAIEAMKAGAFDYVAKPCPIDELDVRIQRALERQSLRRRTSLLERGLTPPDVGGSFLGVSAPFRRAAQLIERIAPTDSAVLVTGETGVGKEMAVRLIHARSRRRLKPFVVVECATLQETLLQSELFGHERGAFTGADRAKPGLFEVAHGGTIFLDEIGEISQAIQAALLRVLDTATFRHVGGTREIHVDVRVLAATNRDLPAMVRQGRFREDLYYRLSTLTVMLPPLRERPEDVEVLASHFVARQAARLGVRKTLRADALEALRRHAWPGNVRELGHVIEAATVVCDGAEIGLEHVRAHLQPSVSSSAAPAGDGSLATLEEMERAHIRRALDFTDGHRGQAARLLGISERNLYRKLREYGLLS
jgi:DNA-binding NtrC family response regulator